MPFTKTEGVDLIRRMVKIERNITRRYVFAIHRISLSRIETLRIFQLVCPVNTPNIRINE